MTDLLLSYKILIEMTYRSPRQVLRRVRNWQALFLLCGLALVVVDIYLSSKGGICQSEGCRTVAASPFTRLYGIPLPWLGAAFFSGSILLLPTKRPFTTLLSLGVGASFYFVFLQLVVLRTICHFCIAVEGIIFATFLVGLASREGRRSLTHPVLAILIGFLGVHAAYTLPLGKGGTEVCPLDRGRVVLWEGPGEERVQFFFDPHCPPCGEAFEVLQSHREEFSQVAFRCVAVHPDSEKDALAFYSLVIEGTDPWEAFERVHGKEPEVPLKAGARNMLRLSQVLLQELGLEEVPTLLVLGREGEILVGRRSIEDHFEGTLTLPTPGLAPDICDPSGCD